MAWIFGDGFDCYAAMTDAQAGYWDSGAFNQVTLVAGRFAGGQSIKTGNGGVQIILVKSSGQNDAVHHITVAYRHDTVSGNTIHQYLQLLDGTTGQCAIAFRSNGDILLTSGTAAGTILATYAGAISSINVWYAFEFEIVIHNTAGSFKVRKDGSTSDNHSTTNINTRVSVNNYANKLQLGTNSNWGNIQFDDLLWRSDAASVPWAGDVRCIARMPASDASVQFSRAPQVLSQVPTGGAIAGSNTAVSTGTARYTPTTPNYTGTIGSVVLNFQTASTCNMKCSVFSSVGGVPTAVLGSATTLALSSASSCTFIFSTPVAVTKGTQYWVGFTPDATSGAFMATLSAVGYSSTTTYASFPVASPSVGALNQSPALIGVVITLGLNAELVSETLQDGTTSYVYDAVPGHADFYTVAALGSTPASTVAVTTRAFVAKSDAGTRTGAVQLRSGASFVGTTWNPADLSAITLSGSNLTATASGTGGVRSVISKASGKHYWEVLVNTFTFSGGSGIGAANGSAVLSSMGSTGAGAIFVYQSGQIWIGGAMPGNIGGGSVTAGSRVCIALDMDAFLIWFRQGAAGNWNNNGSANPATGVGGFSVASIFSGAIPAFAAFAGGPSGDGVTANFGSSAFTGTPPVGFAAGLGGVGATVASPTLALSTSFGWTWRTDTTDPATSTAWTAAAVSAATIGPRVIA